MSREKQIKETRNLREIGCDNAPFEFCNKYDRCEDCPIDRMATALYNAGYRKQSEVIDEFEERLKKVLYDTPSIFTQQRYIVVHEIDKLVEEMKGGAE